MKKFTKIAFIFALLSACLCLVISCGGDGSSESGAHTHAFVEKERTEPTCSAEGTVYFECECGETKEETLAPLPHQKGELLYSTESTCKDEGEDRYLCSVCAEEFSEKKPLLTTHIEEYADYIAPTCINPGAEGAIYCIICEKILDAGVEIPATGIHTPLEYETKYPTCYEPGYYGGTYCSVCEAHLTDNIEVPPQDHRYSFKITVVPTMDSEGEKVYSCIDCGDSYSEVMPKLTYSPEDVWNGSIADSFHSGDGSQENPYVIMTAAELAYFAKTVNSGTNYYGMYITLEADIVLNDTVSYPRWDSTANLWTPIGSVNKAGLPFSGNFDGKNHTVRGLYSKGTDASGLFGRIDYGSIRNVKVIESTIEASSQNGGMNCAGGIVGYVDASSYGVVIDNCHFDGRVYAPAYAGGIVGSIRCGWYQMLSASKRKDNDGYATVKYCTSNGTVSSGAPKNIFNKSSAAGGIVGKVSYCVGSIKFDACTSYADVESVGYGGGIVGTIAPTDNYPGYFSIEILSCENDGAVSSLFTAGGISGLVNLRADVYGYCSNALTVSYCYNKGNISSSAQNESGTLGGLFGTLSVGKDTYKATVEYCHNSGSVSSSGLLLAVGGVFGTVSLQSDRNTLTGCVNTANVNGHSSEGVGGVFGKASASSKHTLTIDSCYNEGKVISSGAGVGGIIGIASDLTLTNVYNTGDIAGGEYYVGGIVGNCAGAKINFAFNTGKVVGSGTNVGSIAGYILVNPTNVYYLVNTAYDGGDNVQGAIGVYELSAGNVSDAFSREAIATKSTYSFNFDTTWKFEEGAEYPTLIKVPSAI